MGGLELLSKAALGLTHIPASVWVELLIIGYIFILYQQVMSCGIYIWGQDETLYM